MSHKHKHTKSKKNTKFKPLRKRRKSKKRLRSRHVSKTNTPKLKQDLKSLTAYWYDVLKADGFDDLEYFDKSTGRGQDSGKLKNSLSYIKTRFNQTTLNHYRLCKNFANHYRFPSQKHHAIMDKYADGCSYRAILSHLKTLADQNPQKFGHYYYKRRFKLADKTKPKVAMSLFRLHGLINHYIKECYRWNSEDVEGIQLEADTLQAVPYYDYIPEDYDT